jgi:hypothetical protein
VIYLNHFKVKNFLFLVLGLLIFSTIGISTTTAQPVIDSNEFPTNIGWQTTDISGGPHDFGFPLPGTPPWDFSTGPTTDTTFSTIVNKAGAPFADSFPAADFALEAINSSGETTYTYFSKTPSAAFIHGFAQGPFFIKYNAPGKILEFPLMMGNSWTDTVTYNLGIDITQIQRNQIVAWGDLTVPAFSNLPSLVLRTQMLTEIMGFPADTSWYYQWMVENMGFGARSDNLGNDSTFQNADDFDRLLMAQQVGVEESNDEYRTRNFEFRLFQNQPNPFQKLTAISYILPGVRAQGSGVSERIPVHLAVYDITGRLVETLVDGMQEPGVYQLPISSNQLQGSGIYFARLSQGKETSTRKIILLR